MIHVVRHAQTPGNAARVFQQPETPLSESGRAQARALGERFACGGVGLVLSSDYTRAEETARSVVRATGATLELEPLLRERSFGELRGTPYAELAFDPFAPDYAPPGGETWETFHARVERAWLAVQERAGRCAGELVVVTHGLVCRAILQRHLALGREHSLTETGIENTAVTSVEPRPPFVVHRLACTAHLGDAHT